MNTFISYLSPGERMSRQDQLTSSNKQWSLLFESDGDIQLRELQNGSWKPKWKISEADPAYKPIMSRATFMKMTSEGQLIVTDQAESTLWEANDKPDKKKTGFLVLHNHGRLEVAHSHWNSGTGLSPESD